MKFRGMIELALSGTLLAETLSVKGAHHGVQPHVMEERYLSLDWIQATAPISASGTFVQSHGKPH
jgi:hypothetical protein